jgi:hypothetical protein
VFGNKWPQRIFGPKADQVSYERLMPCIEGLYDLHTLPSVAVVVKSKKLSRLTTEILISRNSRRILPRRTVGKRPFEIKKKQITNYVETELEGKYLTMITDLSCQNGVIRRDLSIAVS